MLYYALKMSSRSSNSESGTFGTFVGLHPTLLVAHLERVTYLKIEDICAYVHLAYGVLYSSKGMTSWMHNHGFSYKKLKGTPSKADVAAQKAFINEYEELLNTPPEDEPILFGDAVHPTMSTKITYSNSVQRLHIVIALVGHVKFQVHNFYP